MYKQLWTNVLVLLVGGLILFVALTTLRDSPYQVMVFSLAFKVAAGLLAVVLVRGMLKVFDGVIDVNFKELLDEATDEKALFSYFGQRFIGVCLLVGLVVSS